MPRVGFELTTPVSERAKTVHAIDRAATVFDSERLQKEKYHIIRLEPKG
jgi:hypothetical protein